MNEPISMGIDIGATKANIGLITSAGKIIDAVRIPVQRDASAECFIETLCGAVDRLLEANGLTKSDCTFFGVGVPGTADYATGLVEYCPNLGWEDVPAGALFKKYLGADVVISQDSRLAAWAEYLLGAGRGYSSIICVTIGTGIGSGIVIDGKIFHGALNTAGEIGHSVFEKDGRPCNCGNRGCLERYASGTGMIDRALETYPEKFVDRPHQAETIFELAYAGDREMFDLIRQVVEDLAVGIANAVAILSPEAVIISGGLCIHDELIIKPLSELVYQYGYHSWTRKKQL
ncbi:MAG TPA: ROK family protein, partial [Anaerolineae bacterium]|nr:ROK family protein [Anaerolineae bacterium]